jgi:DnaA family protein
MIPAQQLLLGIKPETPPLFDNFVAGANAELVSRLQQLAVSKGSGSLYLWGPRGCGKSHLLDATAAAALSHRPVLRLPAREAAAATSLAAHTLLVVDDVQQLTAEAQIAVFRAFNDMRILGMEIDLLLAGSEPPLRLPLREDLRTRIGQSLIYEVQPLTDDEKTSALQQHAAARGMVMDASVLPYLLRHGRRDLPSLMDMLDALDHASLEFKRPPTLPLLRELMQSSLEVESS